MLLCTYNKKNVYYFPCWGIIIGLRCVRNFVQDWFMLLLLLRKKQVGSFIQLYVLKCKFEFSIFGVTSIQWNRNSQLLTFTVSIEDALSLKPLPSGCLLRFEKTHQLKGDSDKICYGIKTRTHAFVSSWWISIENFTILTLHKKRGLDA